MESGKHQRLSHDIKNLHERLRIETFKHGAETAWNNHMTNCTKEQESYAQSMKELATTHWKQNQESDQSKAVCRIKWSADYIQNYFCNGGILEEQRHKEIKLLKQINIEELPGNGKILSRASFPLKLLDVGSCYNPFNEYDIFEVTAIDIAPAQNDVFHCDFLSVPVHSYDDSTNQSNKTSPPYKILDNKVIQFRSQSFDVIVFSLLLEYLPCPDQRLICCQKAYEILSPEGILVIITPDSKHVGANAKIMKNWRYILAKIGFQRIKYEKLPHLSCMVFRKCLNAAASIRWSQLHKEEYMVELMHIPQDFRNRIENDVGRDVVVDPDECASLFMELPEF